MPAAAAEAGGGDNYGSSSIRDSHCNGNTERGSSDRYSGCIRAAAVAAAPMAAATVTDALSSRDGPATISAVAAPGPAHTLWSLILCFFVLYRSIPGAVYGS